MILTYQDFEKADDKADFVMRAIAWHKQTDAYKTAKVADEYDAQRNTTITNVVRTIYDAQGVQVEDYTVSNNKIASNFFNRLNTQRCMYSLGNGVSFIDPYEAAERALRDTTKERLGKHFDHVLRECAYHALIHGRSYLFWNVDEVYEFKMTEFVAILDEYDASLRAGVRFWRLDDTKPLNAVLYEEDGYTKFRSDEDGKLLLTEKKRAYKTTYEYTEAGDVLYTNEENYTRLPIVTVYASRLRQSTLVGMRDAIDAYDLIMSGFANDLNDCAQIYWIVENYGGMDDSDLSEFLDKLKLNHIANVDTTSGGKVTPYVQDVPTASRESFLTDLKRRIYDDFGALDVHEISAYSTNDLIDAAYQPLDEQAADFEHWISDAIVSLLSLMGIEDTPLFQRDRVSNQYEQVQSVLIEAPYLDRATILRKLPNLTPDDVQLVLNSEETELAMEQLRAGVQTAVAQSRLQMEAADAGQGANGAGGSEGSAVPQQEKVSEVVSEEDGSGRGRQRRRYDNVQ